MSNFRKLKKTNGDKNQPSAVKAAKGFFENNMKFLKQRDPALAERIEKYAYTARFQVVSTGTPPRLNLLFPDGKSFFYAVPDPEQDTRSELEKLNLKNAKAALFLGIGLGYELDLYLRDHAKKVGTTHLIITEKEMDIFYLTLKTLDYASMAKAFNLHFIVGEKEEDLFLRFQEKFASDQKLVVLLKAMRPIFHSSSMKLSKEYYLRVLKAFREAGAYRLNNFGNSIEDSLIGVRNMLENINEIIDNPGINLLFDKFRGKPAIVASTGPSLNQTKHLLKGIEDKALIIAPEASLRPLLEIDVRPHMIVSIERIPEVIGLMEGYTYEQVKDVYYAATPVIMNGAYRAYPGPRIIVYRNFDHFKWLQIERGILNISHSTGNMSFEIAAAMGCDPIILIGQDLAYNREGKTHATGVFQDDKQQFVRENRFQVMANDGKPVMTNALWNLFRTSYELALSNYRGRCINCSLEGAKIKGTEVMPFEEAIKSFIHEPIDPLGMIRENIAVFSKDTSENDRKRVSSLMNEALSDMNALFDTCKNAVMMLGENQEELTSYLEREQYDKPALNRIAYFDSLVRGYKAKAHENKETFQLFFMHIIQSFYLNFDIEVNAIPNEIEDPTKAKIKQIMMQEKWFAIVGDTARICVEMLEKAKEDVRHPS